MKRNEDPFEDVPEWVDREQFALAVQELANRLSEHRAIGDKYSGMVGMGIVPIMGLVMINGRQGRWELQLHCDV